MYTHALRKRGRPQIVISSFSIRSVVPTTTITVSIQLRSISIMSACRISFILPSLALFLFLFEECGIQAEPCLFVICKSLVAISWQLHTLKWTLFSVSKTLRIYIQDSFTAPLCYSCYLASCCSSSNSRDYWYNVHTLPTLSFFSIYR